MKESCEIFILNAAQRRSAAIAKRLSGSKEYSILDPFIWINPDGEQEVQKVAELHVLVVEEHGKKPRIKVNNKCLKILQEAMTATEDQQAELELQYNKSHMYCQTLKKFQALAW